MKKPRDLTIENYKRDPSDGFIATYRISGAVIEPRAEPRIYDPPMHNDVFLDYLEWKANRPWYKRIGLP